MKKPSAAVEYLRSRRGAEEPETKESTEPRVLSLTTEEMEKLGMGNVSAGQPVTFMVKGIYQSRTEEGCDIEIREVDKDGVPKDKDGIPYVRNVLEPKAS